MVGVISIDSHVSAIASTEKPNPTIGRGWVPVDDACRTNGASTPLAIAIGAVSSAERVGDRPHTDLGVEHHRQDHGR